MNSIRRIISTCIFILISTVLFGQTANVQVQIENLRGKEGLLVLGIFDNAEDFKNKTNPFQVFKLDISGTEESHTFAELPFNQYAIAVFHDANGDGKLNTKSMKIPTEGVGVSGKMSKIRMPKFENTSFSLTRDTTIVIQMIYPDNH